MTLGQYIRELRERRDLTQPALLELIERPHSISQSRLSRLENGSAHRWTVVELVALLEALGVPEAEWPEAMRLPVQVDEDEAQLEGAA